MTKFVLLCDEVSAMQETFFWGITGRRIKIEWWLFYFSVVVNLSVAQKFFWGGLCFSVEEHKNVQFFVKHEQKLDCGGGYLKLLSSDLDPKTLVNDLSSDGFKAIWMLDPGIKHEEGYFVYDSGTENNVWVQQADCRPYIGEVWPGQGVFPDFTQEKVCSWWAKLVKDFIANGVDGIWNDMNEPAIFKTVTKTMPESNVHRGDADFGGFQDHSHHLNVYGLLMARSTYEGMKIVTSEKRPFVHTRAGFVGSQRYATTWTGDNLSHWDHLHMSLSMVLLLCLSGQPLSGPDIGGFAANATPKLFGRWMVLGALFSFCCGHSESGIADHEPWSFGEECAEVCRLALLRRYRFLPHLYTLFFMAHTKGNPVPDPTFFANPTDPNLRKIENSFLLSPLLICSSTTPEKGSHQLLQQFPRGIWMSFDFDDPHPDLPTLQLQDETGRAEGLFEDDGDGYGFSKGEYLFTYYVADLQSLVVTVKVSKVEGSWTRPERHLHVHLLLGGGAKLDALGTDGKVIHIRMPSENEVSDLIASSKKQYETLLENATNIPAVEEQASQKGDEFEDIDGDEDEDDAVAIPPTVAARAPGLGQQLFYGQGPSANTVLNGMMQFQIAAAVAVSMVVSVHHSAMTLELHNQFHQKWLPTAAVEISNTMDCTYDELFAVIQDSEQQLGLSGILRRTTWLDSCNVGVSADVGDEGNPCHLPSAVKLLADSVLPTIPRHRADPVVRYGFRPLRVSRCSHWRGYVGLSLLLPKGLVMMLLLPCWQWLGSATSPMGGRREGLLYTTLGLREDSFVVGRDVATFGTPTYN
ncbi:uncharacterized protein [Aristolochia californica]|uniref:uncharacterized protein n=1 Tax=Aristolochia californica TaxID=171875 RepID=UPI0035DC46DA